MSVSGPDIVDLAKIADELIEDFSQGPAEWDDGVGAVFAEADRAGRQYWDGDREI